MNPLRRAILVGLLLTHACFGVAAAPETPAAPAGATAPATKAAPVAEPTGAAETAPVAAANTAATPIPPVGPPRARDLAAYLAALRAHIARDPALRAAYTVFWSSLRQALGPDAARAAADWRRIESHTRAALDSAKALPPGATGTALQAALAGLTRLPDGSGAATAERVLADLDQSAAPRVRVNGRYEYPDQAAESSDLGFASEVWLLCRQVPDCVQVHDAVFGAALGGVSLVATAEQRLTRDIAAAAEPGVTELLAAAADLERQLAAATDPAALRTLATSAASRYWQSITQQLPLAGVLAGPAASSAPSGTPMANETAAPAGAPAPANPYQIDALFEMGRAGAYMAGQPALANAFTVTRAPTLELATAVTQGALIGSLGASAATAGLLYAGVQALALFGAADEPTAPAELQRLVDQLGRTHRVELARQSGAQLAATNAVDTRMAALGAAIDVVRADVARLETAGRQRIGSAYQTSAARRWTEFDADNERCFGARYRDPASGRLRAADFRRCEDAFLQGAVRRSIYANRSSEYVLDARFIDSGDPRFPFHDHYPLLARRTGLDTRSALALPDPLDWQQHATALLALYQAHPAAPNERARRLETLRAVEAAGQRMRGVLTGLVAAPTSDGALRFRNDLHQSLLGAYRDSLSALIERLRALDDPALHPYGKRLTEGLDQAPPVGLKRAAAEALLAGTAADSGTPQTAGAGLATCYDVPASAFEPVGARLTAEARRFFGEPVTVAETRAVWNRTAVDALAVQLPSRVDLLPTPWLWAALEGLGQVDICFARFRPESIAFTREPGALPDTLAGSALFGAELEIRFTPDTTRVPALADAPIVVARYRAERACAFSYRPDSDASAAPCNRAACLTALAPTLWAGSGSAPGPKATTEGAQCDGESIQAQLTPNGAAAGTRADHADPIVSALTTAWAQGLGPRRQQLEDALLRSPEYEAAAALYLEYRALVGVTLGANDPEIPDGMFGGTSPLAPTDAMRAITVTGRSPAEAQALVQQRITTIANDVARRGAVIESERRLPDYPQLRHLDATLSRVALAATVYASR